MNVNVENYNAINGAQIENAKELLGRILQDGVEGIKIILDIGCGSGNVTNIVSKTIPHQKLYGIDIDPKMVEHAIKENKDEVETGNADFLLQDISVPFEDLCQTLRDLEGKVDIVFSNRVLHWVLDDLRFRVARTISRLLRPGGRLYINASLTNDLGLAYLPSEEKEELAKLMDVPSKQRQHEMWMEYFAEADLSTFTVDYLEKVWDTGSNHIFVQQLEYFHQWKRYIPKDIPVEKHDEVLKQLGNQLLKTVGHPFGTSAVNPIETLTCWYYGQFRIVGTK